MPSRAGAGRQSAMPLKAEWAGAIDRYLRSERAKGAPSTTLYTRRQHLQHLGRNVRSEPWDLTGERLADFAGVQDWQPNTRRGRRATYLSFYRWAMQVGLCTDNPAEALGAVRVPAPSPRPVPDDVYLEALFRAKGDEGLWLDLAAEHGLRRGEIAVVWPERDIVPTLLGHDLVVHGKGGKTRLVPLTPAMAEALLSRGPGWAFRGDLDGHISPRWLGKRVTRLLSGDWTIHKLRHRAAMRFDSICDGDIYLLAELMGWANLNMVRTYVPKRTDRLRRVVLGASRHLDARAG